MDPHSECDQEELERFSRDHFTYINQYFGNTGVKQIIMKVYPNKRYRLKREKGTGEFAGTDHHLVYDKENKEDICSVSTEHQQNANIDKGDTLCQTYSILKYLHLTFPERGYSLPERTETIEYKIEKQRIMIKMYRDLLSNERLVKKLTNELQYPSDYLMDYSINDSGKKFDNLITTEEWLKKIEELLNEWEKYGFYFFIKKGDCPTSKKRKVEDSSIDRSRDRSRDRSDSSENQSRRMLRSRRHAGGKTHKKRKNNRITRRKKL
jgi:hypothetical protein